MKLLAASLCFAAVLHCSVAPPVTEKKKGDGSHGENEVDGEQKNQDWDIGLEYNRYLQEVVQALESDPQFREKLEKAEVADIRTGKIAAELEFVSHNVRSKLDELKRQELERLRHLAVKQAELQRQQEHHGGEGEGAEDNDPIHVDHENPHTFEVEDLRKLIVKTTKDLEDADRKRRDEFKEYEMQKEFEKQQQLNLLDEEHKKELEKKMQDQQQKHKDHPSLHHPGSKQQLEEVWEEQDHMNPDDFNPKTFFHLHDLDGNGFWDADEVKALFQKELDKMYDPSAPEDDMRERREEMERMREHVFNETDVNRDQLISYQEFLDQTKKQDFEQDPGWDGLDTQKVYTNEEYHEFEKRRQHEVEQMMQQGLLPPRPDLHLPYGMQVPPEYLQQQHQMNLQYQQQHPQIPPHAQQGQYHPQGGMPHPGQQGYHPNAIPQMPHQGYQQQQQGHPPQGYHPPPPHHGQQPVYQQQQQQGYHPNAIPQPHPGQQGYHPQGAPVYQQQQGIPPQQQQQQHYQQQQQVYQQHPNAPPQGHPNAPPVHQNVQQGHPNAPPHQNVPQGHPNAPPVHQNVQQGHPNAPPHQNPNAPPVYQNQEHHNPPPPPPQGHPNAPPVHQNEHPNSGQAVPPAHPNQAHPDPNAAASSQQQHHESAPPAHPAGASSEQPHAQEPNDVRKHDDAAALHH